MARFSALTSLPAITVDLLIAKAADVNAKDKSGKTPLDIANPWGHGPVADLLRKYGAKTDEELEAGGK